MALKEANVNAAYEAARETYAAYGVDADKALKALDGVMLSMHCWQGDDIAGLEADAGGTSGGIMSTGNYPYKSRTGDELRNDIDKAMSLLPGKQKLNLHASYAELKGEKVDRNKYETRHFQAWIDWAKAKGVGLDFNPTTFGHPKAVGDLTLSNPDAGLRAFWVDHVKATRKIAEDMGKATGMPCVNNIWVQDGMKDLTPNRYLYRELLKESLDKVFATKHDPKFVRDAIECKLFGLGAESYTVGSHEFYMGYQAYAKTFNPGIMITLDMGHFHPTESIADKVSSVLLFSDELLFHVSRGVRWDSDHVVVTTDDLTEVMREIARMDAFGRTYIALDFFDGSINRVGAWVTGIRSSQRAALGALLEPTALLKKYEADNDFTSRLALMDEAKNLPVAAVYNKYCLERGVPAGTDWLADVQAYEKSVQSKRV